MPGKEEKGDEKQVKKPAGNLFKGLMSGSLVTDQIILKNLGYIFMLTILGALYIANRFHAERITRETASMQKEVKDMRAESLATTAELMYASKQSEVYRQVKDRELGLEELREPPFKVIVDRK